MKTRMERNFNIIQGGQGVEVGKLDKDLTFIYVTTNRGEDMILGLETPPSLDPNASTETLKQDVLKAVQEGQILEVEYAILLLSTSANSFQMAPYEGPLNAGTKYMNTRNFITVSFDLEHGIRQKAQEMVDTLIRPSRGGVIVSRSNLTM